MCLEIKNNAKLKTAKKDIVCYKFVESSVGTKNYHTPFKYRPVCIGDTYESELIVETDISGEKSIGVGLHSFKSIKKCVKVALGFVDNVDNQTIVMCVIPKGSQYYEGGFLGTSCYASTVITYVEIVEYYTFDVVNRKAVKCV